MTPLVDELSRREESVLELLAEGFGLREIADRLELTERQARRTRARCIAKLGATGQTHAVALFLRRGRAA
jgi:DNA-binding CsgD family transcriptional regulator